MFSINIICVGKLKEKYLKEAIDEYSKRLSKYCDLSIIEVQDEKIPDKVNDSIINEVKSKEAEKIIANIKKDAAPAQAPDSMNNLKDLVSSFL